MFVKREWVDRPDHPLAKVYFILFGISRPVTAGTNFRIDNTVTEILH